MSQVLDAASVLGMFWITETHWNIVILKSKSSSGPRTSEMEAMLGRVDHQDQKPRSVSWHGRLKKTSGPGPHGSNKLADDANPPLAPCLGIDLLGILSLCGRSAKHPVLARSDKSQDCRSIDPLWHHHPWP